MLYQYPWAAWLYDIVDYPWERLYRHWRGNLVGDLQGKVLEAGVGTGRNLPYYSDQAEVWAVDLYPAMLSQAERRGRKAQCAVHFSQADVLNLAQFPDAHFDWVISTFLCCVMPDHHQPKALAEFARVLKPGGQFKFIEIVYSQHAALRRRQAFFAPWVEWAFGARFDRQTRAHLDANAHLKMTSTRFLKDDTYLLIEGIRTSA